MPTKTVTKNSAKAAKARTNLAKQKVGHRLQTVNLSQPYQILKAKQTRKIKALIAEQKRQEEMRKQFENFLASQAVSFESNELNNNNWYWENSPNTKKRKTRKLRH